ncbi:MAG: hypothetical protein FWE37_08590, partial [Spirochaetaceae bacterium]|nr:hypothetical protein [Spirochaetaceae bacterium]
MGKRFFLISFLALTYGLTAQSSGPIINDTYLFLRLVEATAATKPHIWNNYFILTYSGNPSRFAGVAFGHENFSVVHPFFRTPDGLFVF